MENKDKQGALMLIELAEKLSDLPAHCRIHVIKYAIRNTELVLERRERFNDCCQCLDECPECEKITTNK